MKKKSFIIVYLSVPCFEKGVCAVLFCVIKITVLYNIF